MNNKNNRSGQADSQRRRADEIAPKETAPSLDDIEALSPEETRRMLHELRGRQIELEERNEALRRSQAELGKRVMELEQAESRFKNIEKALRDREARFRGYFDLGLVGMAITSLDKRWVQFNNRLCEILGYPRVELARKTWAEMTHPEDLEANQILFNRVLAGEINGYTMEKRLIHKNGTIIHAAISARCVRNEDGSVRHFVSIVHDISALMHIQAQLIESQSRLALALAASKQGWFDLNIPTGTVKVSPEYAAILGYAPDEFNSSYSEWIAAIHPDDRDQVLKLFCECVETGGSRAIEYRRKTKHGGWVWIRSTGKMAEYDTDNTPLRMVGTHVDISDEKQAEMALQASERKFREVFNNINSGVVICTVTADGNDFIFQDINPKGEIIGNVKKDAIIGKNLLDILPSLRGSDFFETVKRVWRTGNPVYVPDFEYKDSRISGWRNHYLFKLFSGEIVSAFTDETKRKQAEKSLKNSEERFRVLLKNVVLGIFIIRQDNIVYLDPGQEILCGPLFSPFTTNYFDPKDAEKIESFYKEILTSGNSKEGLELRFSPQGNVADSKNMRWVHCKGSRIKYEGDAAVMIALVDVTKVKEMEKVMQLREKMASLGQVAAGIAHEIRNPLSGINIFLEGIAENFEYPENAADIRMLLKEAQKASGKIEATIKRVLDFARPSRPHMTETDINIPVREAIELMGATLRKRDIFIESDLGDSLPSLFLDSLLIEQVVMNLITNAADAMKNNTAPKCLKLTTLRVQNDVYLSISDSGEGVSAALEKKIFDPFFTTKADGSGIGLSFCQRVITDHNGTISLLPSEWGGAQFRIKLPVDKRVLSR